MLALSRKKDEAIIINDDIEITWAEAASARAPSCGKRPS